MWILSDDQNILRCVASEEVNLHQSKIDAGMKAIEVDAYGQIGDRYDSVAKEWTSLPENHTKPGAAQVQEAKTQSFRELAILKAAKVEAQAAGDTDTVDSIQAEIDGHII